MKKPSKMNIAQGQKPVVDDSAKVTETLTRGHDETIRVGGNSATPFVVVGLRQALEVLDAELGPTAHLSHGINAAMLRLGEIVKNPLIEVASGHQLCVRVVEQPAVHVQWTDPEETWRKSEVSTGYIPTSGKATKKTPERKALEKEMKLRVRALAQHIDDFCHHATTPLFSLGTVKGLSLMPDKTLDKLRTTLHMLDDIL